MTSSDYLSKDDISDNFINEFNEIMEQISPKDIDSFWWNTFTGNRDRYNSDFIKILERIFSSQNYSDISKTLSGPFFYSRIALGLIKYYYYICLFLFRTILIKLIFYKKRKQIIANNSNIQVIRSFAYRNSFKQGQFYDPFFSSLASTIHNEREKVVTLYYPLCEIKDIIPNRNSHDNSIPLQSLVSLTCYIKSLFQPLEAIKYNTPSIIYRNKNLTSLLKRIYHLEIFNPLIIQGESNISAIKSLSKNTNINIWYQTYENIIWERYTTRYFRKELPSTVVIGYQHAAIPKAALNYYLSENEISYSPLPHKILTTGETTKELLLKYGKYPHEMIHASCGLRYQHLHRLSCKTTPLDCSLLVILDGHQSSIKMLEFLYKQLKKLKQYRITIRPHPLLDPEKILSDHEIKTFKKNGVSFSQNPIAHDLINNSFALYRGSSVALEALAVGVPIIYFDIDGVIPYDSAYLFKKLHFSISIFEDLAQVMEKVSLKSLDELNIARNQTRHEIFRYFRKVSESTLQPFCAKDLKGD